MKVLLLPSTKTGYVNVFLLLPLKPKPRGKGVTAWPQETDEIALLLSATTHDDIYFSPTRVEF